MLTTAESFDSMKVVILDPSPPQLRGGNRVTALRWAQILRELGCRVCVRPEWNGEDCDLLIALHAIKSFASIERWHDRPRSGPLVVALTGTDFEDDQAKSSARQALEFADHIVVLFEQAQASLPESLAGKVTVIPQSFRGCERTLPPDQGVLVVTMLANLRAVKDPLLGARALALRPDLTNLRHAIVGDATDASLGHALEAAADLDHRIRWVGPQRRRAALELLSSSHALLCTSQHEGGAGAVGEALAFEKPVLSTDLPACRALLGDDHPGIFPVGDSEALAVLLERFATSSDFRQELTQRSLERAYLVDHDLERDRWSNLLVQIGR